MSASKILFGYTLNEKKGFTVESAAKTPFLLLKCSMSYAEPLPGFSSRLRGMEYAFGGDFGVSELRGAMGCCMIPCYWEEFLAPTCLWLG